MASMILSDRRHVSNKYNFKTIQDIVIKELVATAVQFNIPACDLINNEQAIIAATIKLQPRTTVHRYSLLEMLPLVGKVVIYIVNDSCLGFTIFPLALGIQTVNLELV